MKRVTITLTAEEYAALTDPILMRAFESVSEQVREALRMLWRASGLKHEARQGMLLARMTKPPRRRKGHRVTVGRRL